MKAKIIKIGSTYGIILSNEIVEKYQLQEEVILELKEDCIVLKTNEVDPRTGWEEMFKNTDTKINQEEKDWMNVENEFDEKEWTW